jgi:hypothetical protein
MSATIAPASALQARIVPDSVASSDNDRSDAVKTAPSNQSADPRPAQTVSPRQGDAILSLASTDGSTASSQQGNGGSQSVSAANRAYQDTGPRSNNEDSVLRPQSVDDDVNSRDISVGPGGSSGSSDGSESIGGGGTPAVGVGNGDGNGSTSTQDSTPVPTDPTDRGLGATTYV